MVPSVRRLLVVAALALLRVLPAHALVVHHLIIDIASISLPDAIGNRSAAITIRAVDASGQLVPDAAFTTSLRAQVHQPAGVVVSEVSIDGTEIELTNVGTEPVDLEGWILEASQGQYEARGAALQVIQGPAVLAPGAILVWSSRTNANNSFPWILHPQPFPQPRPHDVELRTAAGQLVDQVSLATIDSHREVLWQGPPISLTGLQGGTVRRVGAANRFAGQDWVAGTNSVGSLNPGLVLPWAGPRVATSITPSTITLTNGLWQGVVTVASNAARHWQLGAFSPDSLLWESGPIPLPPMPPLVLGLIEGSLTASEATPGRSALAQVQLPPGTTLPQDLVVALRLDAEDEFTVPSLILIPAGAASAEFAINNLDDAIADGRARVRLTASAPGYADASWILTQDDNEAGVLIVQLPGRAEEGVGLLTRVGHVSLTAPAKHDTEVSLSSTGRLWTAATAMIPKGSVSAPFPVRVLDDLRFNVPPVRDFVSGSIPGWPAAYGDMRIEDNQFPDFQIEVPGWIPEGESAEGSLTFNSPADRPVTVRLSVRGTSVRIPNELVVPAGATRVSFVLTAPDDDLAYSGELPLVCAETDFSTAGCKQTYVRDDDRQIQMVDVAVPLIPLGPGPVPVTIMVRDVAFQPKRVSGTAQVRVAKTHGDVRLAGGSTSVPVVNGEFAGGILLEGAGEGTVLEVAFGEFTGLSNPFSLVPGRDSLFGVADVAAWPGHSNLLALTIETNDSVMLGRLIELNPATGGTVRELLLPSPAQSIAVSDSGTVAWLASVSNTVQRIQLDDWLHAGEVALAETNGVRRGLLVALSPGTTDDLVVLTSPARSPRNENYKLVGFHLGKRLTNDLDLGNVPFGPGLIPGRTPGEFFAALAGKAYRVLLTDSEIEAAASSSLSAGYGAQPALVGTHLVFAGGSVVQAETLADAGEYSPHGIWPQRTAVLPFPDLGLILFADEYGQLRNYDLTTRQPAGLFAIWGDGALPFDRLVRWGSRGAAMVSWTQRELIIVDDAAPSAAAADLGITIELPDQIPWPASSPRPGMIPATLVITNHGPDVAVNVRYSVNGIETAYYESLAPGASIVVNQSLDPIKVGFVSFAVAVATDTRDPVSDNNSATDSSWVEPLEAPGQAVARLRGRHLAARPDGTELWVATGPEGGSEGVTVLDPETGARVRTIEVGPDPRRLAPMADNRGFYVQLGASRVVRWNLEANAIDFDRTFAGQSVIDLASLPGVSERLAILLRGGLFVIEGTNQIQALPVTANTHRTLAVGGGQLWTAADNELRVFNLVPNGLALIRIASLFQANGDYRFTTDGHWAAFGDHIYDPVSGLRHYTEPGSVPLVPGSDSAFYGVAGYRLRRLTVPDLMLAGEAAVPALSGAGAVLDQVRWGSDGFAFRTESGLIVSTRSAAVPTGQADLALSIEPVGTPIYLYPSEFRVVVTNRGPDSVQRFEVSVSGNHIHSLSAAVPSVVGGGSIRIPVEGLPAGQAREVRFTAVPNDVPFPTGRIFLQVDVVGSANDPQPADNRLQAELQTRAIPANLGIHFELPTSPAANVPFEVVCVLTNAGPAAVSNPSIYYRGSHLLQWLSTDKGRFHGSGNGELLIQDLIPLLAPESAVRVRIRMRVDQPGVFGLRASVNLFADDPDTRDNLGRTVLYIPAATGSVAYPNFSVGFSRGQWSPARHEWIVGDEFGLTFLDADTLAPTGGMSFPFETGNYLQNEEGTHVWLGGNGVGYDRYDLSTGQVDLQVPLDQISAPYRPVAAALPGRPDTLLLFGIGDGFKMEASVVVNGKRLPDAYSADLTWQGRNPLVVGTPENRVFVSNGGQLRELEITASGLRFVRNLDAYDRSADQPMAVSGGLLVQGFIDALDLASLTWVPAGALNRPIFDALTYRHATLPDNSSRMEAFDLVQRRPLWASPWTGMNSSVVGAGTRGALLLGYEGGLLVTPTNRAVDLRLEATEVPTIAGVGREFPVNLRLRQSGAWLAGTVRIQAELPPGIELVEPAIAGTFPAFTVPFTLPSTNLTLRLRAAVPGPVRVRFQASSEAGDPTPDDAQVELDLNVPPAPVVLLNDLTVTDNGEPFILRLSHPAPEDLSITLQAQPITTQPDDLVGPTLQVTFLAGRSETEVYWIQNDWTVEGDEQVRLSLAPGPVAASAAAVTVTIRNDDQASFSTTAENRLEGNANAAPALVQVTTDVPLEVPVEIGFTTVSGTAQTGEDFLPLAGRLIFTSEQRTNVIRIAIVGDTAYEATETFTFNWLEPRGALLPRTATTVTLRNDDPIPTPVATISPGDDGRPAVEFFGLSGVRYTLQARELLTSGTWQTESGSVTGTGGILTFRPVARTNHTWFYRLQAN